MCQTEGSFISDERCQVAKSMMKEKIPSRAANGLLENNLPIGSSVLPSLSMASCLILLHDRCPIWVADTIFAVFCCLPSFLITSLGRMFVRCKGVFFGFHGQRIPDFKSNRECMECHVATSELDLYIWVVMIIGFYRYSFNFTCIYIYISYNYICMYTSL